MTLPDLALDYVAHLEDRLRQLLEGSALTNSWMRWTPADSRRQWPV